jgi:hypothetical protein
VLLALFIIGVSIGLIATYLSTGSVLHEPHGRIGVLMMVLIGATACLAPSLHVGVAWARTAHMIIGITLTLLLLYLVMIPTGGEIIQSIMKAR